MKKSTIFSTDSIRSFIILKFYNFRLFTILSLFVLLPQVALAGDQYWGGSGTWQATGTGWSAVGSTGSPYTSAWTGNNTSTCTIAYFNIPNSTVTGPSSVNLYVGGINATENVTFTAGTKTIGNGYGVTAIPVEVAVGKVFDFGTQGLVPTGTGITKNGAGELALSTSSNYTGGFTLNAGQVTIGSVNALSKGPLTINGGIIAANGNQTEACTSITIGGDFTLGAASSLAPVGTGTTGMSGFNITFPAVATSLGSSTRTITLGGTGTYTFGGVISGTNVGITLAGNASGTLAFTNPSNTYSGATTLTSGTLKLNPSSTPATFVSQLVLNGGTLSTAGIAAATVITNSSTLNLTDNSKINLGIAIHSLIFANNSSIAWTAGKTLTITGWTGTAGTSGSAGKIFFGSDATGLTADQLAQITFTGYSGGAKVLSTGELVPASGHVVVGPSYQHIIMYGQSLSVGNQSWPYLSTTNIPGNYMIGSQVWINLGNTGLTGLTPLTSTLCYMDRNRALNRINGRAECPITAIVNHIQRKFNNGQNYIATSCGTGGKSIEELSKECQTTTLYNDYLTSINSAYSIANSTNSNITCPAICWMQGEWNYKGLGTGLTVGSTSTYDKNTYKSLLVTLKNNMQMDVMNTYGQTSKPLFITYECGAEYTVGYQLPIGMAQLEASNENDDIVCAGPVYPVCDRGGHLDPNGYRWYGEMMAKAYYKTKTEGTKFVPLQPILISRTTDPTTIKIQFHVPKLPLVLDCNTLDSVPNYGFAIYNDSVQQVISKVSIVNDCVNITCNTNLTGKVEVTYAGPITDTALKLLNGNGNLRDNDDYKAFDNYIDLDKKNPDGTYFFPRDAAETTLRPDYEPKDSSGSVIYDKPYPLYNFCVAFYYKLDIGQQSYTVPISGSGLSIIQNKTYSNVENSIYQVGNSIKVNTGNQEFVSLKLYDLKGNVLRTYSERNKSYDISELTKGVYLADLKTRTATNSTKIILK